MPCTRHRADVTVKAAATMRPRFTRWRLRMGAAVLVLLLAIAPAGAEEQASVDALSAAHGPAGFVWASGQASIPPHPGVQLVAVDPVDAEVPVPGGELRSASIDTRDPDKVTFVLGVQGPAAGQPLPEALRYQWDIVVDTPDVLGREYRLEAFRSSQVWAAGSVAPIFRMMTCQGLDCRQTRPLQGSFGPQAVTFDVPMSYLQAAPGDPLEIRLGAGGLGTSIGPWGQDERSVPTVGYLQPTPVDLIEATALFAPQRVGVSLGIAPATVPEEQVRYTRRAPLDEEGAFGDYLELPAEPGPYIVVAMACGGGTCVRRSVMLDAP